MDYETALKLKNAGYPQLYSDTKGRYYKDGVLGYTEIKILTDMESGEFVYIPTLEELIEACPKTITGPNKNTEAKGEVEHLFRLGFSGDEWFADYEFYNSYILHEHGYVLDGWGKTPSEAVANLWLSLHTK